MAVRERLESVREGPRSNPFSVVFGFICGIFAWIFHYLGFIVAIGIVIVVIIFFGYTLPSSGGYGVWWQEVKVGVGDVPVVGPVLRFLGDTLPAIVSPERFVELQQEYGWKASIDENVGNRDLGLKFDEFKAQSDIYTIDDGTYDHDIVAFGKGKINSLMEDSEVSFECDTDDGKINGEVVSPYGPISVRQGITKYFNVKCNYNGEDFALNGALQKAYTLRLKADYSFSTLGYLTIYTMGYDKLNEELERNNYDREVIFYNVNDKHLNKKTGEVESTYTYGPVKLILSGWFDQPLSEAGPYGEGNPYNLQIILKRDINWDGTLKEINNVYFYAMDNIEVVEGEESEFEYVEDKDLFRKYRLKSSGLEELNNKCLNEYNVFDINCWKGSNVASSIDFNVNVDNGDLSQLYVRVEVEYVYQTEEKDVIKFIKKTT